MRQKAGSPLGRSFCFHSRAVHAARHGAGSRFPAGLTSIPCRFRLRTGWLVALGKDPLVLARGSFPFETEGAKTSVSPAEDGADAARRAAGSGDHANPGPRAER